MPFKSELHLQLFTEFYIQPLFPTMPLPLSTQENTTQLYQIYTLPTFPCSIRFWLLHGKPPASWSRRAEQIIQKPFNNLTFSEKKIKSVTQGIYFGNTPPLQVQLKLCRLCTQLNLPVPSVLLRSSMNNFSIQRRRVS